MCVCVFVCGRICNGSDVAVVRAECVIKNNKLINNNKNNTDTQLQYFILIAFPQEQWLRVRVSLLRYTYIDSVVIGLRRNVLQLCKNRTFNPLNAELNPIRHLLAIGRSSPYCPR